MSTCDFVLIYGGAFNMVLCAVMDNWMGAAGWFVATGHAVYIRFLESKLAK